MGPRQGKSMAERRVEQEPEATAKQSSPVGIPGELFDDFVAQNFFDVVHENLLSTRRVGLLAKQCLGGT